MSVGGFGRGETVAGRGVLSCIVSRLSLSVVAAREHLGVLPCKDRHVTQCTADAGEYWEHS